MGYGIETLLLKKIVIKYPIPAGSTILIYRFSPPILFSASIVFGYRRYFSQRLSFIGYRDTVFRYRFIGYRDKVFHYLAHHWFSLSRDNNVY